MSNYTNQQKLNVWNKGKVIQGKDADMWRRDSKGNPIKWQDYGMETKHGWEVDHIIPIAKKGSNALSNLQPLQWQANRRKSDNP